MVQLIRIHEKIKAFSWDWEGLSHTESICKVEKKKITKSQSLLISFLAKMYYLNEK